MRQASEGDGDAGETRVNQVKLPESNINQTPEPNFETVSAWIAKGDKYRTLKQYEEALSAFEHAVELDPSDPNAWYSLIVPLCMLNRFAEAFSARERAWALVEDPGELTLWLR